MIITTEPVYRAEDPYNPKLLTFPRGTRIEEGDLGSFLSTESGTSIQVTYAHPKWCDDLALDMQIKAVNGYFLGVFENSMGLCLDIQCTRGSGITASLAIARGDPNIYFPLADNHTEEPAGERFWNIRKAVPPQVFLVKGEDDSVLYHDSQLESQVLRFDRELKRRMH